MPEDYGKVKFCSNSPDKLNFNILKNSMVRVFKWGERLHLLCGLESGMINKVTSKNLKQEDRMLSNGKYISLSGNKRFCGR